MFIYNSFLLTVIERSFANKVQRNQREKGQEKWQINAISSDQTSGRPGYELLSYGRIESVLTRSELEVVWITDPEGDTNGFGKVLGSDGS